MDRRWSATASLILALAALITIYYWVSDGSRNTLKVLTYASFAQSWGPGPSLAKNFEAAHHGRVEFITAADAGLLMQKIGLSEFDVIIGLDQLLLAEAKAKHQWHQMNLPPHELEIPMQDQFIPYDWSPLAFIYRPSESQEPHSWQDLLSPSFAKSIALEDPRTSTPGLMVYFWILDDFGIEQGFDYLQKLAPQIHSISPSWSTAYGLFQKNLTKLVASYLTSPIYHIVEEKSSNYKAALLDQGHPVQTEYMAVSAQSKSKALAETFVRFLLNQESQRIIMQKNYMLPVRSSATKSTLWENLNQPKIKSWKKLPELIQNKATLLDRWKSIGFEDR